VDHHSQDPRFFRRTEGTGGTQGGKPRRSPYRTRQDAIETALSYYRANHHRSGIRITEAEYRAILEQALSCSMPSTTLRLSRPG
jgi:hypothetical protein